MRRAARLIAVPRRQLLFRLLPPLLLSYGILLPVQLNLFPAEDLTAAARYFYTLAQIFLLIAALWPQFCYFLSVYQEDSRELLQALRHPDGACALLLWLEHQLRSLPLYIIYLMKLPEHWPMLFLLLLQSLCITAAFMLCTRLFHTALEGILLPLGYLLLSLMPENAWWPLLLQKNRLLAELPAAYFLLHGLVFVGLLLLWRTGRGKSRQRSPRPRRFCRR